MKVLLIYPAPPRTHWPWGSFRSRWAPSGIMSIAACLLRDGHEVRVHICEEHLVKSTINWNACDEALAALLRDFAPGIVGLSVVTPAVSETARIAALARKVCGHKTLIVAGGPHATAVPEMLLSDCHALDAVAVGEGEATMCELALRGLQSDIAGLVIRDGDSMIRTAPRSPISNLDSLPPMPYDLLDMGYYTQAHRWMIRWLNLSCLNIRTSRGCTNACRFCAGHIVGGVGVRMHSVTSVVQQVAQAVERFGVRGIHFEDDTVGADPARLIALSAALREAGLHRRIVWDCCLRVDQVSAELLGEMKAAGCVQVEYGFESGSDRSLRSIGKAATVDLNRRAVELTRAAGLRIFADIIVGLPGETGRDIQATVDFLRFARPEVINASRLFPLPGTALWDGLPDPDRAKLAWADYAYFDRPDIGLNFTAMGDAQFERAFRRFMSHVVKPATKQSMLRDWTAGDGDACGCAGRVSTDDDRDFLRRRLRKFIITHPLAALRVPWRR